MLERPSSTGPRPGACSVQPKKDGRSVPFERCLADAYACLLSSSRTSIKTRKPELVMLVSHEIATRGWNEVREDEVCKIQGFGPISPAAAREIASDAFLSGLSMTAETCATSPLDPQLRWRFCWHYSWGSRPSSMGSSASIAAAAFETRRNTRSLMSPGAAKIIEFSAEPTPLSSGAERA